MPNVIASFEDGERLRGYDLESDGTLYVRLRVAPGDMWSPPEEVATLRRPRGFNVYVDSIRKVDAEIIGERDDAIKGVPSPKGMHDALAVILLDPVLRPMLEALDPKAVQQARAALLLT